MRVLAINSDWGSSEYRKKHNKYGGVGYYRLVKPLSCFDTLLVGSNLSDYVDDTKDEETLYQSYRDFVAGFDVVITKVVDNPKAISTMVMACEQAGVPLLMDIDDNYMEVLPSQPAFNQGYKKGGTRKAFALAGMSMVTAIITSTKPLADYYQKTIKEMFGEEKTFFILPNCNDINDWQFENGKNTEGVVIGWHGSITHDDDLALVAPALGRIMDDYPEVRIAFSGGIAKSTLAGFQCFSLGHIERIEITQGTQSWEGFPRALMGQKWDIGIAPLVDCEFNRGKSHIKWMELAMKEIPVVASRVYPYSEPIDGIPVIEDGKTGFLVDENGWYDALKRLVEDKKLRERVGKAGKKAVIDNWQYKDHHYRWKEALEDVVSDYKLSQEHACKRANENIK